MIWLLIILAAGLLLVVAISVGGRGAKPRSSRPVQQLDRRQIAGRWQHIQELSSGSGLGIKSAVAEADKLFDHVLKQKGYPGDTMAERLKHAQKRLSDPEAVWRARKLRNSMAHDVDFDLVVSQAKDALRGYETGLKDLGAL